jgi:hypothetical protein
MHSGTFIGEVQQGQLHVSQPLTDFEGKQVQVTLIAPPPSLPDTTTNVPPAESSTELDVEVDLFAPMPVAAENLGPQSIRTVAAVPCLIFPELADE